MRESRKLDHIRWALDLPDGPAPSGLDDIKLVHNALPGINRDEISIATEAFGCRLAAPILINAITGGNLQVLEVNRMLARAARETGLGIAVGSQTGAILVPELAETFSVVRRENPRGLVIANVGAGVDPKAALTAVEMIEANALQVHLNVPQELAMGEGDRNFSGIAENIARLVEVMPVPVVVKEVGFGIAKETALQLQRMGVTWLDIGGAGGTNFISIEHRRGQQTVVPEDWGISTACSLGEVAASCPGLRIIASGGIRTPLETIKCLCVGASLVGIAGLWLKILLQQSYEDLLINVSKFGEDIKTVMLMLGVKGLIELPHIPAVFSGATREWLTERGVDTRLWAQRG
ncbi:MAG TPA: type 2 isopentenyl-diphosphate Delta-isomerase [Verrucomicrobiae bacterium]|nr:type 2 isopentenyl-diphosphate Delta-isomerase [Verrucomicrobiae bacterium]